MKNRHFIFAVVIIVTVFILCGCKDNQQVKKVQAPVEIKKPVLKNQYAADQRQLSAILNELSKYSGDDKGYSVTVCFSAIIGSTKDNGFFSRSENMDQVMDKLSDRTKRYCFRNVGDHFDYTPEHQGELNRLREKFSKELSIDPDTEIIREARRNDVDLEWVINLAVINGVSAESTKQVLKRNCNPAIPSQMSTEICEWLTGHLQYVLEPELMPDPIISEAYCEVGADKLIVHVCSGNPNLESVKEMLSSADNKSIKQSIEILNYRISSFDKAHPNIVKYGSSGSYPILSHTSNLKKIRSAIEGENNQ